MAEIEPRRCGDYTRFATGEGKHKTVIDRKQIGVWLTTQDFERVKAEAIHQDVSMAEVMRQLVDLL